MSIADNVKAVKDNIACAAIDAGVDPNGIRLVAATKQNSAERVREAIAAGIEICGENRVQELLEKDAQGAYAGAERHFIGHLQRNKVKNVVGLCDLIQSAGSQELIELISRRAAAIGKVQDILIEVNIGGEESKSGFLPEALDDAVGFAAASGGVKLLGLMAIPPQCDDPRRAVYYFDEMYKLFVDIGAKKYDNVSMEIMSMGMSGDYMTAIRSGSNMVRVGTAIFGARQY